MTSGQIIPMPLPKASIALARFEACRQALLRAWDEACAAGQVSERIAVEEAAGTAAAILQMAALRGVRE